MALHLHEELSGHMHALTETGAFHLKRLRLNRPPLVALRQARRDVMRLREGLAAARVEQRNYVNASRRWNKTCTLS